MDEKKIDSLRMRIDVINRDIARLVFKRIKVVERIAAIKKRAGIPIVDVRRERQILAQMTGLTRDKHKKKLLKSIFQTMLKAQRRFLTK